jgi:general stress protein YciG
MSSDQRREARARIPAERRREIARMGGLARAASAGADTMRAIGAAGHAAHMKTSTPQRRSEIARKGAEAANASMGPARKREIWLRVLDKCRTRGRGKR